MILAILIIVFTWLAIREYQEEREIFDRVGSLILLTMILFPLYVLSSSIFETTEERITSSSEIVSLKDNSYPSGSFLLGTGTIGEKSVYVFYKNHCGGYIRGTVPVSGTVIYEGKEEPRVECWESFFALSKKSKIIWWPYYKTNIGSSKQYKIYVLENTVIKQFVLDSE